MDRALDEAEGERPSGDGVSRVSSGEGDLRIATDFRGFWREACCSGKMGWRTSCSGSSGLGLRGIWIRCWPM